MLHWWNNKVQMLSGHAACTEGVRKCASDDAPSHSEQWLPWLYGDAVGDHFYTIIGKGGLFDVKVGE